MTSSVSSPAGVLILRRTFLTRPSSTTLTEAVIPGTSRNSSKTSRNGARRPQVVRRTTWCSRKRSARSRSVRSLLPLLASPASHAHIRGETGKRSTSCERNARAIRSRFVSAFMFHNLYARESSSHSVL